MTLRQATREELLIELVEKHTILYDHTLAEYKDDFYKTQLWEEIGSSVNTSGPTAKKLWESLRAQYSAYLRKIKSQTVTSFRQAEPFFRHRQRMKFLENFVRSRINRELRSTAKNRRKSQKVDVDDSSGDHDDVPLSQFCETTIQSQEDDDQVGGGGEARSGSPPPAPAPHQSSAGPPKKRPAPAALSAVLDLPTISHNYYPNEKKPKFVDGHGATTTSTSTTMSPSPSSPSPTQTISNNARMTSTSCNEHELYLLSLAPTFDRINDIKKIAKLKIRIQQLLYSAEFGEPDEVVSSREESSGAMGGDKLQKGRSYKGKSGTTQSQSQNLQSHAHSNASSHNFSPAHNSQSHTHEFGSHAHAHHSQSHAFARALQLDFVQSPAQNYSP